MPTKKTTSKKKAVKKFTLTSENYFSPDRPHVSNSQISDYFKSPAFYKLKHIDKKLPRKVTDPMKRGSVADQLLTQPDGKFERKFERTCYAKDNRKQYDKETKIIEKQKEKGEDFIVGATYWDQAEQVANYIKSQPFWKKGLKKAVFQEVLEGELEGMKVCGLPDRLDPLPDMHWRLSDVKVVNPIKIESSRKWYWNAVEMGYLRQLALYQHLWAEKQGIPAEYVECCHIVGAFVEIGLSKVALFKIPQPVLDVAFEEVMEGLRGIRDKKFDDPTISWG